MREKSVISVKKRNFRIVLYELAALRDHSFQHTYDSYIFEMTFEGKLSEVFSLQLSLFTLVGSVFVFRLYFLNDLCNVYQIVSLKINSHLQLPAFIGVYSLIFRLK